MSSIQLKSDEAANQPQSNSASPVVENHLERLDYPLESQPLRIYWPYALSLIAIHILSLLALIPYFFSISALVVAAIAHTLFDGLGVSIGYHRLLTHRGFVCPKWLERTMAICGICTLQDSPARWVAVHRMHHQYSDHQPDPHSPLVDFLWGHVGWLLFIDRRHDGVHHFERYVRDLLRDRFYLNLERKFMWLWIYLIHAFVITILGYATGLLLTGTQEGAIQLAGSGSFGAFWSELFSPCM